MVPAQVSRRKFLKAALAAGAAGALGVSADAVFRGARDLTIERIELPLARLSPAFDGFTIAQLSDFHYDPHFDASLIAASIQETNELNADIVVLTGDYVTQRLFHYPDLQSGRYAEPCAKLLSNLSSRLGTFAVLGNHDYADPDTVARALTAHGIHVFRNSSLPLEKDGARLWLGGTGDGLEHDLDYAKALRAIPQEEPRILLVHEPDCADEVTNGNVDLQLSGHSHGGQIRLPVVGPPYLPPLARKYPWGLRKIGGLTLYTNRGIGTIRIPARLNSPPEITLFALRARS